MATPVFCCGFECGVNGSHWTFVGAGGSYVTSGQRSGARAARILNSATLASTTLSAAANINVVRVYVKFSVLPTADTTILAVYDGAGNYYGVGFKSSDSKIYASKSLSGALTFGSTGVLVTTDLWYCINLKVDATNNPWTIDVDVNGTAASQLTNAVAARTFQFVRIGSELATTVDLLMDDVLVSQTGADYPLSAGYIQSYVPTSDGTHNIAGTGDFQRGNTGVDILNSTTTAYQLVDEVPLPSGTVDQADCIRAVAPPNPTDYVECVFGPAPGMSAATIGPRAVEVIAARHEIATTVGSAKLNLNDNGTVSAVYDRVGVAGVTTYEYNTKQFATPPTGGAWGVVAGNGNFNALRCRYYSADANPDQCLDGVMIEAEFALLLGWGVIAPDLIFDPLQVVPSGNVPGRMP